MNDLGKSKMNEGASLDEKTKETEKVSDKELNQSLGIREKDLKNNKIEGIRREKEVENELQEKYPESEGYEIISEAYLRDSEGKIVKDPETNSARRIDFVVIKDGKVIKSVEVTSFNVDKTEQLAKEKRIKESGGCYIKTLGGELIKIPENLYTDIERRK